MKKLILLLLFPLSVSAQKDISGQLKQFLEGQHRYFNFNGNVLAAIAGMPFYEGSFGYADFNSKRLLNDSSVFELASVSKQFTAMGIMILKEKGKLSYDDNIQQYFPALPYNNITIRHLLTHTSGIPSYEDQFEKNWDRKKIAFNKDIVDMLIRLNDSLRFKPGSKWEYSNTGYALLASIIEKVSGTSYADFLSANIFKPLAMRHSFVYNTRRSTGKIPPNYALGFVYVDSLKRYILPDNLPANDMVYYLDGIVGDGCVNSTTGDLLRWEESFTTTKLVSKASLDEMLSPLVQMSPRDTSSFYGFGVMVKPNTPEGKIIFHTGGWPGYSTYVLTRSKKRETLIVLSNNETLSGQIRVALESLLNGEDLLMPYEHKQVTIDPALIDRYVGKYSAFVTLVFIKKDDKLYRHRDGTPDIELKPESNTKFFYGDGTDRQVEFEVDAAGQVTKAWFINTGQKGELKKIQ
ncbi:MAG: serine hydrolase [Chitinophagaceae bacterium]